MTTYVGKSIRLDFGIRRHWLWTNAEYLMWWIDLVMEASEEEKTVLSGATVVKVMRGEVMMSRAEMVKRWGTTEWKARMFVKLLEENGMIEKLQETSSKASKITICEYDSYVDSPPDFRQTSAGLPPDSLQTSAQETSNLTICEASSCEDSPPDFRQTSIQQKESEVTSLVDNNYYYLDSENNINNNRDNNNIINNSREKKNGEPLEIVSIAEGTKITEQMAKTIPPPMAYVEEYCRQRGNGLDVEAFYAFYESKGWMVGKTKMKKWTAAVVTWEIRKKEEKKNERTKNNWDNDPNNGVSDEFLQSIADILNS